MSDEDLGYQPTKADSLPARTSEASGRKRSAPLGRKAPQEQADVEPSIEPATTFEAALRAHKAAEKMPTRNRAEERAQAKAMRETGAVLHAVQQGLKVVAIDANIIAAGRANTDKIMQTLKWKIRAKTDRDFARLLKQSKQ